MGMIVEREQGNSVSDFGQLLRRHRVDTRLTQEELAERAGLSVRTLSDLERGCRKPRRSTTSALADALDLRGAAATTFRDISRSVRLVPTAEPLAAVGWQLPGVPTDFIGRSAEMATIRSALGADATTIVVISGQPGAGKTTLALHAAHQFAFRFPDAQLYVDLRGTDHRPAPLVEILARLLRALGLADQEIPADTDAGVGRYRSLTHHRSVLVVLDNAADENQVRPLVPTGTHCCALVTSRQALLGLNTSHRITLGALATYDAERLLQRIVGADKMRAEPRAARALLRVCGNLPLAIRIVGNRLASRPAWSITALADVMRDQRTRLARLRVGDLAVRPAFMASYEQLSDPTRTLFALLSLVPGPDVGRGGAAAVIGGDEADAVTLLDELADAHMLEPSDRPGRYRFHDLLRLFAHECLTQDHPPDVAHDARARWLAWFVAHATAAGAHLDPTGELRVAPAPIADRTHALAWLNDEYQVTLAFAGSAAELGGDAGLLQINEALAWYFDLLGRWEDWRRLTEHAVAAAHRTGNRRMAVIATNHLGLALFHLRRVNAAIALHRDALSGSREVGDVLEEVTSLHFLGVDLAELGQYAEALDRHHEALALGIQIGKPWVQMRALGKIADCLLSTRRFIDAIQVTEQARLIGRQLGNTRCEALSCARLGQALHGLGHLPDAITSLTDSIALFHCLSDPWSEGWARHSLGLVLQDSQDVRDAIAQYDRALELFCQCQDRHWQKIVLQARRIAAKTRQLSRDA